MKKVFHAPALPEVKPPRAPIEGRPRGSAVPTYRVKDHAESKGSWRKFIRMVDLAHEQFFQKRPWVKIS